MVKATFIRAVSAGAAIAGIGVLALAGPVQAQGASADLGGTYKCQPNPDPCLWSGASATVTQSGNKLQIKGENGALADATLTSPTTISAAATLNSLGIVRSDKSIDWSDGTKWRKQ